MVLEVPNNKKENQNQLCATRRNPISFLPKQKVNILLHIERTPSYDVTI